MHLVDQWLQCPKVQCVSRQKNAAVVFAHGLRLVVTQAAIDVAEVEQLLKGLTEHSDDAFGVPIIYDLRGLDFTHVTTATIKQWVNATAKFPAIWHTPAAFIVGDGLGFGMMRMFQTLSDVQGLAPEDRFFVSYSVAEAVTWVRHSRLRGPGADAPSEHSAGPWTKSASTQFR